jgi:hypothetical protein
VGGGSGEMDCGGNIVSGARLVNFLDDRMKLSYEFHTVQILEDTSLTGHNIFAECDSLNDPYE